MWLNQQNIIHIIHISHDFLYPRTMSNSYIQSIGMIRKHIQCLYWCRVALYTQISDMFATFVILALLVLKLLRDTTGKQIMYFKCGPLYIYYSLVSSSLSAYGFKQSPLHSHRNGMQETFHRSSCIHHYFSLTCLNMYKAFQIFWCTFSCEINRDGNARCPLPTKLFWVTIIWHGNMRIQAKGQMQN